MVRGFYPGYDSELHEVYVYEKVNRKVPEGTFFVEGYVPDADLVAASRCLCVRFFGIYFARLASGILFSGRPVSRMGVSRFPLLFVRAFLFC